MFSAIPVNNTCCLHSSLQLLQPPTSTHGASSGAFRMGKKRRHSLPWILTLESKDVHLRNNFNKPWFLCLPIQRKTLKSLPWDVSFLWLAILFDIWLYYLFILLWTFFVLLYKIFLCILPSPLPLWSSSSDLSERLPPRLYSSVRSPNKT